MTETALASMLQGELYSESNFIPKYGILTDSQLRFIPKQFASLTPYLGVATQSQSKTSNSQEDLYAKNYVMAVAGFRYNLIPELTVLAEFRTEERSRFGFFSGKLWEYSLQNQPLITDVYFESVVYPSFHTAPVTTAWLKEGLRYKVALHWIFDPFIEAYIRRSPTPDLGRDTEQLRLGLRTYYSLEKWILGLLVYESFSKDEGNHEEALLVIGGSF